MGKYVPAPWMLEMEALRAELAQVKAERDNLRTQISAALRVFSRFDAENTHKLTQLEKNRICGLPDDWKRLSERYPEHFGGTK